MSASIDQIDFHGLPALELCDGKGARTVVALFGAQVLSWIPAGSDERLYLSDKARFDGSSAIRGGIPVCFPQFAALGKLPKHGLVRQATWAIRERRSGNDHALVTLGLTDDECSRTLWPGVFDAELTVVVEQRRLDVEFAVRNTGHAPFAFTAALHSYLRVHEVENASLEGLYGYEYRDATDGNRIKRDTGEAVRVDAEVNRVYHDVRRPLLLRDSGRNLGLHAEGFPDVVVWNPWEEHCATLQDMPPLGFRRMLCVEAAAARQRIALDAGDEWTGRQTLIAL